MLPDTARVVLALAAETGGRTAAERRRKFRVFPQRRSISIPGPNRQHQQQRQHEPRVTHCGTARL